jgi:monothiol glutaredoxin
MEQATRTQIDQLVKKNHVVLFMKGSRHFPQCGFSATVAKILDGYLPKYETVNVLSSAEIRDGIKEYSSWPTIPQLYIDGKFVGGCDIIKELDQTGELGKLLGSEKAPPVAVAPPKITIDDDARAAIVDARKDAGGDPLRIVVGPHHEYDLFFEPKQSDDVVVESSGVTFVLDRESASRAGDLSIAFVAGQGFRVDSSKAPPRVKSITPSELKKLVDSKAKDFVLVDVRGEAERKIVSLPNHKPLDPNVIDELAALSAETRVVVYCHHGVRSQNAAQQLVSRGVKNVYSLAGGIDAYANVDSTIARY